jgi:hypothetical protein
MNPRWSAISEALAIILEDSEGEQEDFKTAPSHEAKRSAIAESLKPKPASNLPPAFALVASSKPFRPKPRQLPAQTDKSAAIAESLKPSPASNLPSALASAASSSIKAALIKRK